MDGQNINNVTMFHKDLLSLETALNFTSLIAKCIITIYWFDSIEDGNTLRYVNRTNIEYMKLGLIGRTVVVASGDDGNAGGHSSPNDCTSIVSVFPAASPYILAVGATSVEQSTSSAESVETPPQVCTNAALMCSCSTSTNEQIASQNNTAGFDTGGGFSVYASTPAYQAQAVKQYLTSGVYLPPTSLQWNTNGRGYPDLVAVGENICVVDPGR
jgi:tripeptidyl-peptidase-1